MTEITIATWNVNSIKARLPVVERWLREAAPDVVLLQELKTVDEGFPRTEIEDLGYNIALHGQKTYNGVAILSRFPLDDISRGLDNDASDEQARFIEGVVCLPHAAVRVASVYVPNGEAPDSEKFAYKMRFFERLYRKMQSWQGLDEAIVLGGDYNVAPEEMDIYDPKRWDGQVCFHPAERQHFRALKNMGFVDAYREARPTEHAYSWWDYRGGAYEQGKGLRIDHLLLNPQATDMMQDTWIDSGNRAWEKPSDHAPVVGKFKIG